MVLRVPDTRRPELTEAVKQQLARVEADADDREPLGLIEAAADRADRWGLEGTLGKKNPLHHIISSLVI